jgi:hypothetical protein
VLTNAHSADADVDRSTLHRRAAWAAVSRSPGMSVNSLRKRWMTVSMPMPRVRQQLVRNEASHERANPTTYATIRATSGAGTVPR